MDSSGKSTEEIVHGLLRDGRDKYEIASMLGYSGCVIKKYVDSYFKTSQGMRYEKLVLGGKLETLWETIEPLFNTCENVGDIVRISGLSPYTVTSVLRFVGKTKNEMPNTKANVRRRKILNLYDLGFSNSDMAKKFSVSREMIRQDLDSMGIRRRKGGPTFQIIITKSEKDLVRKLRMEEAMSAHDIGILLVKARISYLGVSSVTKIGQGLVRGVLKELELPEIWEIKRDAYFKQMTPEVLALRKKGLDLNEINKETGLHTTAVSKILRDNGHVFNSGVRLKERKTRRPHGSVVVDAERIVELRLDGLTYAEIKDVTGVYPDAIEKILKPLNMSSCSWLLKRKEKIKMKDAA